MRWKWAHGAELLLRDCSCALQVQLLCGPFSCDPPLFSACASISPSGLRHQIPHVTYSCQDKVYGGELPLSGSADILVLSSAVLAAGTPSGTYFVESRFLLMMVSPPCSIELGSTPRRRLLQTEGSLSTRHPVKGFISVSFRALTSVSTLTSRLPGPPLVESKL